MRYRCSVAKWVLLAFAILITLTTLADKTAAFGSLAGGLWVAYAVLHAADRLRVSQIPAVEDRPGMPTER